MAIDAQRQSILDQFTKQAIPFSEMHARDEAGIYRLLFDTAEIGPDDEVLDVACGPGLVACEAARLARQVTGVDLTPAMIEQARARQKSLGLTNMAWVEGDAQPLPFADAQFSRVVSRYAFHHLTDPAAVFDQMVRVCRPGGRVTVADVFSTSPEQAAAYDQLEKWRDPSHTHALLLEVLDSYFASLSDVRRVFYKYPVKVDDLLSRAFPDADGATRFREAVAADIGRNRLGIDACRDSDGLLGFAFPVVILSGRK